MKTPIEIMIDRADMKCTKCGAKMGMCDCWTKCKIPGCAWSFEKGKKCRNPDHKTKTRIG
jgi:hypothetical protein